MINFVGKLYSSRQPANMLPLVYVTLTLSLVSVSNSQMSKYPCAFIDTVNITGSYPLEMTNEHNLTTTGATSAINISYIYQWMIVPPELIAVYDFVIENGVRLPTERHLRACVCKLKPCIRFCCQPDYYYDLLAKSCLPTNSTDRQLTQNSIMVHFRNETTASVSTSKHFLVHHGKPCENMRLMLKNKRPIDWTLYENGTIAHKNVLFTKHYCYSALPERDKMEMNVSGVVTWQWQPLACVPEKLPFILGVREWTYAICLIITVICMIIILLIYLFCTDMRNTFYGVAIKSYALCIIIGYSMLAHLTLTNPADMSKYSCSHIPIVALLYLILSFYILSFISFNFYLSFFGVVLSKLMFWFIFFPIVFVVTCWSLFVSFDYYNNKPVFGNDMCWFDPRNLSIVVYLYAPILMACLFCGIFYTLSLLRMSERMTGLNACINKLMAKASRNRFKSFWKFFIYTAISWLVCMISFVYNYYRDERTHINYVVCLFVALHGFGSLYSLIGENSQIQNFLRRIEEETFDAENEDVAEISVPMTPY